MRGEPEKRGKNRRESKLPEKYLLRSQHIPRERHVSIILQNTSSISSTHTQGSSIITTDYIWKT